MARIWFDLWMRHPFAGTLATWPTSRVVEKMGMVVDDMITKSLAYADTFQRAGEIAWESPYRHAELADMPVVQAANKIGETISSAVAATITAIARSHHDQIEQIEAAWNSWRAGGAWDLRPLKAPEPYPLFDPEQEAPSALVLVPRTPEHAITRQSNRELGENVAGMARSLRANAEVGNTLEPGYDTKLHPGALLGAIDRANTRHAKAAASVYQHAADWLDWAWAQIQQAVEQSFHDGNHWHSPRLIYPGPDGPYWQHTEN